MLKVIKNYPLVKHFELWSKLYSTIRVFIQNFKLYLAEQSITDAIIVPEVNFGQARIIRENLKKFLIK